MKFLLATLCLLTAALNCEALQRKEAPPLKLHSVFDAPATPPQSIFWSAQSGAEATSHSYPGGRDDYNKRIIAYSLIGAFGLFFIAGFLLMVHAGDVATQAGHPGDRDPTYQLLGYAAFAIGFGLGITGAIMIHNPWDTSGQKGWR